MKKNNSESECTKSKNHVKCKIIVKRLNCLARKLIYLESPFWMHIQMTIQRSSSWVIDYVGTNLLVIIEHGNGLTRNEG